MREGGEVCYAGQFTAMTARRLVLLIFGLLVALALLRVRAEVHTQEWFEIPGPLGTTSELNVWIGPQWVWVWELGGTIDDDRSVQQPQKAVRVLWLLVLIEITALCIPLAVALAILRRRRQLRQREWHGVEGGANLHP